MIKEGKEINALIIANGFEGILSKVCCILHQKHNITSINFAYLIRKEDINGISGLNEEIDTLSEASEKLAIDLKDILLSLKKNLPKLKEKYNFFVFSSEGDKQFILLLLLFFINRKNIKYLLFNLQKGSIQSLNLMTFCYFILMKLFSRSTLNLFLNRISRYFRLSRVFGYPDNLIIEPVNFCNLKCKICLTGLNKLKREKGKIDKERFFKIMDEGGSYIRHLNLFFMGEPFLHENLLEMVSYAKKSGVEIVELNTNGNLNFTDEYIKAIVHSGIDMLVFSIDGSDQRAYEKYRKGGKLELVLDNIRRISSYRDRENLFYPKLLVQFIIMKHNINQMENIKEIVKSTGADGLRIKKLNLKMADLPLREIKEYMPIEEEMGLFYLRDGQLVHKKQRKRVCNSSWDSMVITWDGYTLPCCGDFDGKLKLGNIFKEGGIKKVWNNKNYRSFREQIKKDFSKISLCKECPGN